MGKLIVMRNWIVLTLLFCGCTPTYVPNVRNSPLFTKGGEVQGSFQFGNGLDAQAAVSLSSHIGVMANYNYANRDRFDPDDYDDYHRHRFFEGGIGYFTNDASWCVEVFAGYGRGEGSGKNEFLSSGSSVPSTGKYERYFFQPAFGLNKKMVHVAFIPRFSMVNFTAYSEGQVGFSVEENPKFFFEPAVMGRVNFADNHLFFTFQGGYSTSMSNDVYFSHRRFQISTGLGFRLGGLREASKMH
jgi:hypothetical protein